MLDSMCLKPYSSMMARRAFVKLRSLGHIKTPFRKGGSFPSRPVELHYAACWDSLRALGVGLLLVHDPGVGEVEQLGHRQQVVEVQAVGFLPVSSPCL